MNLRSFSMALGIGATLSFGLSGLAESAVAFERTEDFAPISVGPRARLSERTLVFAEFLNKYGMFQNYLHYWIDRPLFWDRAIRPERMQYETPASFAVHAEQLRKYGLDGLDVFANLKSDKSRSLAQLNDWFVQGGFDELKILPIIGYGEAVDKYGPNPAAFKVAISAAQADPRFPRVSGKVLVPTYNYRLFTAAQHREFMAALVKELGNDDFILCGQPNASTLRDLQRAYRANGRLTDAEKGLLDSMLREVLDIAGGIQLNPAEKIREPEGPYCSHYSTRFFDEQLAPAVLKLFEEPKYRGKALGFYINQGYINNHSGHNHAEDGTSTLRRSLRSALRLNPDYLLLFEWNELNENTMFQPTVWNGQAVGRLIRHHTRLLKGLGPDVYPGDDTSVPDLTLSHRATVKVGEVLDFEILNVPDGVRKGIIPVQLKLFAEGGRLVNAFPVEKIDETKFGAIAYRMSTAGLRGGEVLNAVLEADGKCHDSFHPIRISATVSWNYKMVRHSLRDQMRPRRNSILVRKAGPNRYAYSADLAFDEPLASVELIANEGEQDAAGIAAEFDREHYEILEVAFSVPPKQAVQSAEIRITTPGSNGCRCHGVWTANVNPGVLRPLKDGAGFSTSTLIWSEGPSYLVAVPRSDVEKAELRIEVTAKSAPCKAASVPVKSLFATRVFGAELNDSGARVDIRRQNELADLPPHLKSGVCAWQGETVCEKRFPVFHVRAISETGRIWRSRPFRPEMPPQEDEAYPAYDEFAHGRMEAVSPKALVPVVDYAFDPATGAALKNAWEPDFDATLGGGFKSDKTFSALSIAPPNGRRAPEWTQENGRWCLRFDGVNDYISLPREAFPQAAFTLSLEIRPELAGVKQMTLFRHFDSVRGSLSLFIREGKLFATWGDRDLSKEPSFETGLVVKDGEWNAVSVGYDFREFTFRVNGAERRIPWQGRAWCFKPSVFGGHSKVEMSGAKEAPAYYKGLLRNLKIEHRGG